MDERTREFLKDKRIVFLPSSVFFYSLRGGRLIKYIQKPAMKKPGWRLPNNGNLKI
jgi:hypothetical protein